MDVQLADARASFADGQLCIGNDAIERRWRVVPEGLVTTAVVDRHRGRTWVHEPAADRIDWSIFVLADGSKPAELMSMTATPMTDDPWTGDHVLIEAMFRYAYLDSSFDLRFRGWVYPEVAGIRTQLALRPGRAFTKDERPSFIGESVSDRLALDPAPLTRHAIGYYTDTQHRNLDHTPLIREQMVTGAVGRREIHDWASLLALSDAEAGLVLVKESHKCVNQPGLDTGAFVLDPGGVSVTGLGYENAGNAYTPSQKYAEPGVFRDAWATWLIACGPGERERELAVKRFDRARFAPRPERNLRIRANTWGSRGAGDASREAATEPNVLRELEVCGDLGVDQLCIDDGWQCDPRGQAYTEDQGGWRPNPQRFPHGWQTVRQRAAELDVRLALWNSWGASAQDMIRNHDEGGFEMFKVDFVNLKSRDDLERLLSQCRQIVEHSDHQVRISFDLTESLPRTGYYFARELGNLYLENREQPNPRLRHISYKPHLVLRDAWQLAKYVNLNQVEVTFKDKDEVPLQFSSAARYSHAYCFAITMMGLPLFFFEVQTLDPEDRDELRPLIALYKQHREAIYAGYVSPIGDEPDDAGWTGFTSHDFGRAAGYLTLFREIGNDQPRRTIDLPFVGDRRLELTDLLTGATRTASADEPFDLASPGDFVFLRYELI